MLEQRQRVGCYAVCVRADGSLLLCRMSPQTRTPGFWTLPGGGVRHGEDPGHTVIRELAEETGLDGEIDRLVGIHTNVYSADQTLIHGIRLIYRVRVTGGELRAEAGDTTDHAQWFHWTTLPATTKLSDHARLAVQLCRPEPSTESDGVRHPIQ